MTKRNKWDTEKVKACVADKGWSIPDSSWQHKNHKEIIPLVCPKGHSAPKNLNSFLQGKGCLICSGKTKHSDDFVRQYFQRHGWLISQPNWKYKNSNAKIPLICSSGHRLEKRFSSFQAGERCAECYGNTTYTTQYVKQYIESNYWTITDIEWEYINNTVIIPMLCPYGHESNKSFNAFQQGARCGECFYGSSLFIKSDNFRTAFGITRICNYIAAHLKKKGKYLNRKIARIYLEENLHPDTVKLYGQKHGGAQIDHIIPTSWFNLLNEDEVLACFHPENLRVISALDNIKRSNNLTIEEASTFSKKQLNILFFASRRPTEAAWDRLVRLELVAS